MYVDILDDFIYLQNRDICEQYRLQPDAAWSPNKRSSPQFRSEVLFGLIWVQTVATTQKVKDLNFLILQTFYLFSENNKLYLCIL